MPDAAVETWGKRTLEVVYTGAGADYVCSRAIRLKGIFFTPSAIGDYLRVREVPDTAFLLGDEVLNGAFTTTPDLNWVWGSGWSQVGAKARHTPGAGEIYPVYQELGLVPGSYVVTFTTSSVTAGTVTVGLAGVSGTARSTDDTFIETIEVPANAPNGYITFTPTALFDGDIDVVSVLRVPGPTIVKVKSIAGETIPTYVLGDTPVVPAIKLSECSLNTITSVFISFDFD